MVLLIALLGALAWQASRPREPAYQGRPLSAWLSHYALGADPAEALRANEAIRQIGTNAIPTLLRMLQANDSAVKSKLLRMVAKQHFVRLRCSSAFDQNVEAVQAFGVLGSEGKSAVPALVQIYEQSISKSPQTELMAVSALGCIGPAATDAIPSLLKAATNPDFSVRGKAILVLGRIHARPDLVVPALIKALTDDDDLVRKEAAKALGEFGTCAKSALPALVELHKGGDEELRNRAQEAVQQIDPMAADKVPRTSH